MALATCPPTETNSRVNGALPPYAGKCGTTIMVSVAFRPTPTTSNSGIRRPEVFAQFQSLPLIGRSDAFAVEEARALEQLFVYETRDGLAVFEDERDLMRADLERCPRAVDFARAVAEAGIEEARIVNAKLSDRRVERNHFCRILRGDPHLFARSEDVEIFRIENQRSALIAANRIPEFFRIVMVQFRKIDQRRMPSRAIPDHRRAIDARQIHGQSQAVLDLRLAWNIVQKYERLLAFQLPQQNIGRLIFALKQPQLG